MGGVDTERGRGGGDKREEDSRVREIEKWKGGDGKEWGGR